MDFKTLAYEIKNHTAGVAFGIPGSGATLSLIDELEKIDYPFYLTHFEGSASLIAATVGKLSGKPGISLSIKGPGLVNALPGIATAFFESMPLIHITEAYPSSSPVYQAHKKLHHEKLVSSCSKAISMVNKPYGECISNISSIATSDEPGPVVLELVASEEQKILTQYNKLTEDKIRDIISLINTSSRPILILGTVALKLNLSDILNTISIPVFTTTSAKGIIDETLEHSAGVFTGAGGFHTPEAHIVKNADLVIGVGLIPKEFLVVKSFGCKSINLIDYLPEGIDGFAFDVLSSSACIHEVLNIIANKSWGIEELIEIKNILFNSALNGFLPGIIFQETQRQFNYNIRAVFDTGSFCTIGEHIWLSKNNNSSLLSGNGRYMGSGIPMALGAAMFDKSIPTVAFVGDGGIGMYLADVKLAVKEKLPLLIVLLSDGAFASIRTRAIKDGITQKPLFMDGRSWVSVFEAFGIESKKALNIEEYVTIISSWAHNLGPMFLEVNFDKDRYEEMVHGIR